MKGPLTVCGPGLGKSTRGGWSSESLWGSGSLLLFASGSGAGVFSEPECKLGQTRAEPSVKDVASPDLQQAGSQGTSALLPAPASTLWSSLVPPSGEPSWKPQVLQGLVCIPHIWASGICVTVRLSCLPPQECGSLEEGTLHILFTVWYGHTRRSLAFAG